MEIRHLYFKIGTLPTLLDKTVWLRVDLSLSEILPYHQKRRRANFRWHLLVPLDSYSHTANGTQIIIDRCLQVVNIALGDWRHTFIYPSYLRWYLFAFLRLPQLTLVFFWLPWAHCKGSSADPELAAPKPFISFLLLEGGQLVGDSHLPQSSGIMSHCSSEKSLASASSQLWHYRTLSAFSSRFHLGTRCIMLLWQESPFSLKVRLTFLLLHKETQLKIKKKKKKVSSNWLP